MSSFIVNLGVQHIDFKILNLRDNARAQGRSRDPPLFCFFSSTRNHPATAFFSFFFLGASACRRQGQQAKLSLP